MSAGDGERRAPRCRTRPRPRRPRGRTRLSGGGHRARRRSRAGPPRSPGRVPIWRHRPSVARTTSRFILAGPAPSSPRSPAVPKLSGLWKRAQAPSRRLSRGRDGRAMPGRNRCRPRQCDRTSAAQTFVSSQGSALNATATAGGTQRGRRRKRGHARLPGPGRQSWRLPSAGQDAWANDPNAGVVGTAYNNQGSTAVSSSRRLVSASLPERRRRSSSLATSGRAADLPDHPTQTEVTSEQRTLHLQLHRAGDRQR